MKSAAQILLDANRSRRLKVLVVGDTMMDEYVVGHLARFSPEAPVPIFDSAGMPPLTLPGGAGNVARQFKHWNADVQLFGITNEAMSLTLDNYGIDSGQLFHVPSAKVPLKRRYYDGTRLVFRQDHEFPHYGVACRRQIETCRRAVVERFTTAIQWRPDVVVLSDYGKGLFDGDTLRSLIALCRKADIPSIADPKGHPSNFAGVTILKPNEKWVHEKGGPFEYPGELYWFKKALSPTPAMVYTRGSRPPRGYHNCTDRDHAIDFSCERRHRQVAEESVVGAGDCFLAHLAIAVGHGLSLPDAAEIAYSAGRAYVQDIFNEPVLPQEVAVDIDPLAGKVVACEELQTIRKAREEMRAVLANGCFDMLHPGHISTLQFAARQGNCLVVAVNTDEDVRVLKGLGRPIQNLRDRCASLAALECVDYIVPFAATGLRDVLIAAGADVLVKGAEARSGDVPGADLVSEVHFAPETHLDHTTDILRRLRERMPAG